MLFLCRCESEYKRASGCECEFGFYCVALDAQKAEMTLLQVLCAVCLCESECGVNVTSQRMRYRQAYGSAADTLRVHVCQCGCEYEFVNVRYRREWQRCKYTPRACVPMWMRIRQCDVATDALQAGTVALQMHFAYVCVNVNVNVDLCM